MSKEMTPKEHKEIYKIVKDTFYEEMARDDAVDRVKTISERRKGFRIYYAAFGAMQTEEVYEASIGENITRCFLESILEDFEEEGLKRALNALKKHIEYRITHLSSRKMEGYRPIHAEFSAKLSNPPPPPALHPKAKK